MKNADGIFGSSSTPYLLFAKEQVNQIKISNPDCTSDDMMKIVCGFWKNLSIEDKKVYNDLFEKNKEECNKTQNQAIIIQVSHPDKETSWYFYDEAQRED